LSYTREACILRGFHCCWQRYSMVAVIENAMADFPAV
jgi:hypothetical protein